jgi:hypothetical protein
MLESQMSSSSSVSHESSISELIKCPLCRQVYQDPRMLPCGYSLCERCILSLTDNLDIDEFDCQLCLDTHTITSTVANKLQQFPLNLFIVELCSRAPHLVQTNELKDKLSVLDSSYKELERTYHASLDIIHGYCEQVRQEVSTSGETFINKAKRLIKDNLEAVGHYEAECVQNFEQTRDKFEKRLAKLKLELDNLKLSNNSTGSKKLTELTDSFLGQLRHEMHHLKSIQFNGKQLRFVESQNLDSMANFGDFCYKDLAKSAINLNLNKMRHVNISDKCKNVNNSLSVLSLANLNLFSLCYLDKDSNLSCMVFDSEGQISGVNDNLAQHSIVDYFKQIEFGNGNVLIYAHKLNRDGMSLCGTDELIVLDAKTTCVLKRVAIDCYLNDLAANSHILFCLNLSREVYAFDKDLNTSRQQLLDIGELPLVIVQMECNSDFLFFLYSEHLYSFKMRIVSIRSGRVMHDLAVCGDQFKFLTNDIFVFYCDFKKKLHLYNWEDESNVAASMNEEVYDIIGVANARSSLSDTSTDDNNNNSLIGTHISLGANSSGLRLLKGKSKNVAFIDLNNLDVYF